MSKTDNSAEWTFTYDADGMRTGRTNGTTTYGYVYNGGQLTQMTLNGETVTFGYDASGKPESMTYQGETYYYVTNLQGDVVHIVDSSGTWLVHYYYTAYGSASASKNEDHEALSTTLIAANPLTYRGYVYDQGTSLYYLQSRYYNPNTGRFLNADALVSTGQGLLGNNMFAYCGNNPTNRTDPTGEFWWIIPALIIPVILTACGDGGNNLLPRSDLANAPDLDINTAPNNAYNCYGNAIGKQIVADPTGYRRGDSVEKTFLAVQRDLGGEKNCVRLDSYDSPIEDGWYVVAMMCGETDYHFIRQDGKGWYNKSGYDKNLSGCYIPFEVVNTNTWYALGAVDGTVYMFKRPGDPVYRSNSGPLYFAVRSGWDE